MSFALSKNSCFDRPFFFALISKSIIWFVVSSPSPRKTISTKSVIGSGLQAQGPPTQISGVKLSLSLDLSGICAKLSILSIFVYESSY